MKTKMNWTLPALMLGALTNLASGQIVVPGADGSDGALLVTEDTVIDLRNAIDGVWDQDNSANIGSGVYDPEKWAVVFKYSEVKIEEGATLTFRNHSTRAPVVWLVSGDVEIFGSLVLDGEREVESPRMAEPGPGGFRGGTGRYSADATAASGLGPGGGRIPTQGGEAYGGVYGKNADDLFEWDGKAYGNPSLIPLIGGSGGSGDVDSVEGGGAGGGAILIATQNNLIISGSINANGGHAPGFGSGAAGSGGGIRLIANTLQGTGSISAIGGEGWRQDVPHSYGTDGRIRIERAQNTSELQIVPDPSVIPFDVDEVALIWPPETAPTVRVISVEDQEAPSDPVGGVGAQGPDIALPQLLTAEVIIETVNVEEESLVQVRVTPRFGGNFVDVRAEVATIVETDPLTIRWTAETPVRSGYSFLQVKVVRP